MITQPNDSAATSDAEEAAIDTIVQAGPGGAIAVAGTATAIVVIMWFAFYLLVFLPRAPAQ